MKKFLKLLIFTVLIFSLALSLMACKSVEVPKINDLPIDYSTCEVAENLNAFELFTETYNNFKTDKNYKRTEYFSFEAKLDLGGMIVATQQGKLIKKMDNDKVYAQSVTVGTGLGDKRAATRFYSDGVSNKEINIADVKLIPNKGSGDEIFNVSDWGNYKDFVGDATSKINTYRNHITTYDLSNYDYLADTHNNTVYYKENVYYFTLEIDCSKEMMETIQADANKEFYDSLNPDAGSLVLENNTILDFAVAKVGGKFKFLAIRRFEKYYGKQLGAKTNCEQTTSITFSYEKNEYTVNDKDLLK